tara:strand:- start:2866 stop:3333 length:468 start_codon:yes stop_codon:yes gene_type:complete
MGSRKLSLQELLKNLQYEYICCEIRSKTYVHAKHRAYWEKVGEYKKEKIINISEKQNIASIFTDISIENAFKKMIYSGYGLPAFVYKNEQDREVQEKWDILNFFYRGTRVEFFDNEGYNKGKAIFTNPEKRIVEIKDDSGIKHSITFDSIKRLLW